MPIPDPPGAFITPSANMFAIVSHPYEFTITAAPVADSYNWYYYKDNDPIVFIENTASTRLVWRPTVVGTYKIACRSVVGVDESIDSLGSNINVITATALNAHRYWRVYVFSVHSAIVTNAATLQLKSVAGGSDVATGGTAFASTEDGTNTAAKAFDGNSATIWRSTTLPAYIGYDKGAGNDVILRQITWKINATVGEGPSAIQIQWSDDGVNYYPLWGALVPSISAWTASQSKNNTAPTATMVPVYDIDITGQLPALQGSMNMVFAPVREINMVGVLPKLRGTMYIAEDISSQQGARLSDLTTIT